MKKSPQSQEADRYGKKEADNVVCAIKFTDDVSAVDSRERGHAEWFLSRAWIAGYRYAIRRAK